GAQVGEGADADAVLDPRVDADDVRGEAAVLPGRGAAEQAGEGADDGGGGAADEGGEGISDVVAAERDAGVDAGARGVGDRHPGALVEAVDALLGQPGDLGEVDAVVDAERQRPV